ncbi:MAG TPA: hypothetical protein VGD67_17450 [Pseudonocardiaceae bacterium]
MGDVLPLLAIAAGYATLLGGLVWLAARARRRRAGAVLSAIDEIFNPASHRTHVEVHAQYERHAPAPLPGDPDR